MTRITAIAAALAFTLAACATTAPHGPEARPFAAAPAAYSEVESALVRAAAANKRTILVFGYDACHDSRGLAGWFATPRFRAMLAPRYEIVWIDTGIDHDLNTDLAKRYGVAPIVGTPTVVILGSDGQPLNTPADALGWRNAASRSERDIYDYFEKLGGSNG